MRLVILYLIAAAAAAILGIDFGQQFTKAVLLAPGIQFELVLTDEGKRKDLSGVSIRPHPDNKNELERVYGSATGSLCTRFPQSCILHLKSLLGKAVDDQSTIDYLKSHFVKLVGDESRSNAIKIDAGIENELFTVEEVIAMSLNDIRQRAISDIEDASPSKSNSKLVLDVAVSIAPFASQSARQSYIDALQLSNFTNILGLIDEGTAVALNFVSNKKLTNAEDLTDEKEYHLIYDMGAGSTSATLFSFIPFKNGTIHLELENFGFDESFGGQLLTNSLYDIIKSKFLTHFDLRSHEELPDKVEARILEAAEKAKIVLSVNNDYHVSLESIYNEKDFKTVISKEEFEDFNSDLTERITKPIFKALEEVEGVSSINDIKSVVLTGGSTRVPFVQKHLVSLIGEERISKNVNADESCAVGTTLRAFKLKTHLEKAKDIKIVDKAFHAFEFSIGSEDEPRVLFPRGSIIGNDTRVDLSELAELKDKVDLSLYEDGKLIKSYSFDELTKKGEKLKCKNKKDSKHYVATFSLDNNKIFDLTKLEIECVAPEKPKKQGNFIQKLLNKEDEEDAEEENTEDETEVDGQEESESGSENSTNSTNSTSSKKTKPSVRLPIQPRPVNVPLSKPSYSHVKPLSSVTKERISKKLASWNSLDENRFKLDAIKNILEGQCYEFRSFIEDNEEVLENEITSLSDYTEFVGEAIEWLEFESDGLTIDHFNDKIKALNSKKNELKKIIEMSKADLSIDALKKIYEEGTNVIMSIQKYLIDFGKEISELRQKFEDEGFNFDKENDKIKLQLLGKAGGVDKMMVLDQSLSEYRDHLTALGDIVDLDIAKFKALSREEIWEVHSTISQKVIEMLSDIVLVEQSHKDRISLFESKLRKLQERKAQKEFRDKLKEAAKKKKEEEKEGDKDEKKENEEETEDVSDETKKEDVTSKITEKESAETENIHDEL